MKTTNKATVLIIDNSLDKTGAFKAIYGFAKSVKEEIKIIFIFSTKSTLVKYVERAGFEVRQLPFVELSKKTTNLIFYFPMLLRNAFALKKIVKQKNIRLVHVNDFYNLVGVFAKLLGGNFSLITHVRFMPDRFPSILVRIWVGLNLKYSEKIVCVSDAVRNRLPKHSKITTIYDTTITKDIKYSHKEPIDNTIHFLYLAHYIPGKGQDLALESFSLAYAQNPSLRLIFAGGDMGLKKNQVFKRNLIKKAQELGLKEFVKFKGYIDNIWDEMTNADVILNFSESESFSFVCLEAMFCGKPLISTDCGGPAELIEHGVTGWIVPNKDVISMKEALLFFAENMEVRSRIGKNALLSARSKFSKKNTYDILKDLYNIVLVNKRK